jgi:hypothetical protein
MSVCDHLRLLRGRSSRSQPSAIAQIDEERLGQCTVLRNLYFPSVLSTRLEDDTGEDGGAAQRAYGC